MKLLIHQFFIFISLATMSMAIKLSSYKICAIIFYLNIRKYKNIPVKNNKFKNILIFPKSGGVEDIINSFDNAKNNNLKFFWIPRVFIKKIYKNFFKDQDSSDYFTKSFNANDKHKKKMYINFLTNTLNYLDKIFNLDGIISFNIFYYAEKHLDIVCKNLNKKFIVLQKESALTPIEEIKYPTGLKKYNEKSLAHKISVYSENQKKILLKSKIGTDSQITVNGCARSDYSFKLRSIKPKKNTLVHFLIETKRYTGNKFQRNVVKKKINWNKLFDKTLEYLIEFAKKNPNIDIILKGKIGTHKKELFDKIILPKNCRYIFTGTGENLLKISNVVIAFNSTVVFETIASNRNLIIPNFYNENVNKKNYMHRINKKKYFVNTKKDFFKKIKSYLNSQYKNQKLSKMNKQTLKYYLGNIDGKSGKKIKEFLIDNFSY